jgi:hypothetical protein
MARGGWVPTFLERSRSSRQWATWPVWLLGFESAEVQVSTRSSSENRTETTTISISREVNRGLFGLNPPAAHGRALERGQALLAPAFRAKGTALREGRDPLCMESSSPARARDDCGGQAIAKADAVTGARRDWFGVPTLCLCKAQEQRPTRILVPRGQPALGVV